MALKKDKEKVIDPVWGEERIREFLELQAPENENADHHKLLRAYQSMRLNDFETFLGFFQQAGGDINAQNTRGQTVAEIIRQHRNGSAYADAVEQLSAS